MTNEELWRAALGELEIAVSKASFATWFKDTSIMDLNNGVVTIAVPNPFVKEWLELKYHKLILKAVLGLIPGIRSIEYCTTRNAPGARPVKMRWAPEEQLEFNDFRINPETNLNPKYTFGSFIVGSFNEVACAASLAVTEKLGNLYNPLFIYGGVGLGKTHLLQAIGNKVKSERPELKVKYVSSEKFTNELVSSIQNKEPHIFKEKYRQEDLLLIDDVQFIAGKTKTQEEFFHTFNALYEANKQIVFTSDKPPKAIQHLEERLKSRFEGGMIADVTEPEYESRLAILKTKIESKNIDVSPEVMEYIALTVKESIRELEGALNLVHAKMTMIKRQPTVEEVKEELLKTAKPKKTVTANQIIKVVADYYDIEEKLLFEKTRRKEIVSPRQIAMYLLREDFNGSFPFIGQKFGGRDHTTAIHAYEKINKSLNKDEKTVEDLKQIREKIHGP